jgi:proteasome lid subunit RPN8/RPN11
MKIYLEKKAAEKIAAYTNLCDIEIQGYGKIEIDEDGDIFITDAKICPQKNTGVHTSLLDDGQLDFWMKLHKEEGEDDKKWKCHWHSHVDMGVFWSGEDKREISGSQESQEIYVSIVTNKKGEYKARVDFETYNKDLKMKSKSFMDDVPVCVRPDPEKYNEITEIEKRIYKIEEKMEKVQNSHKEEVDKLEKKYKEKMDELSSLMEFETVVYDEFFEIDYTDIEKDIEKDIKENVNKEEKSLTTWTNMTKKERKEMRKNGYELIDNVWIKRKNYQKEREYSFSNPQKELKFKDFESMNDYYNETYFNR